MRLIQHHLEKYQRLEVRVEGQARSHVTLVVSDKSI